MNINQWTVQMEAAYESANSQLLPEQKLILLRKPIGTKEEIDLFEDAEEKMMRFFFRKVVNGDTFGSTNRIKEIMGKSLEDNYRLTNGPFLNMAKAYWTFKIELEDLFPTSNPDNSLLAKVLRKAEEEIAEVFFPHPMVKVMSAAQRAMTQEKILKYFAPEIDVKKFTHENPIIKTEATRGGCLGTIILFILIPTCFLAALAIIVK